MDHINGNNMDNRLHNLRLLCPNCHSQTSTFRGKNKGSATLTNPKPKTKETCKIKNICKFCSKAIKSTSKTCKDCMPKQQTKITWPSQETLVEALETTSFESLARNLGVSSNAIRKYLKKI